MSFANLSDVFDKLLAERKLAISREDRKSAETLRVSLTRKLVQYKSQMESVGYLDADIAVAVVSLEWTKPNTATYFLRPRKGAAVTYKILEPVTSSYEQQQTSQDEAQPA